MYDRLIGENIGLARHLAERFTGHNVDREDLLQEARIGVWQAALKFDPSRGLKFSTLASTIIVRRLLRFVRDAGARKRFLPRGTGELVLAAVDRRELRPDLAAEYGEEFAPFEAAVEDLRSRAAEPPRRRRRASA